MSNTGSNVQVLLGAEDFSEFLQLSQLTSAVSARDKLLIEKLVDAIEVLNEKQKDLLRQFADTVEPGKYKERKGFFDKMKEFLK